MAKTKKSNEDETQYVRVLRNAKKDNMFSVLVRNPTVFSNFRERLDAEHFSELDAHYAVVWQATREFYAEHNEMPKRSDLMAGVSQAVDDDPDSLSEEQVAEAEAFIDLAFDDKDAWQGNLAKDKERARRATKTLQTFLEERLLANIHDTSTLKRRRVADVMAFLASAQTQIAQIRAITGSTAKSVFPDDEKWSKKGGIGKYPTGISFFDELLAGGHAPGEVYGFLGPFGSCKTTVAVMLAVQAALQAAKLFKETGEMQYVFYASYEAPLENELRFRIACFAAEIRRDSMENLNPELGLKSLSTRNKLREYEKIRFKDQIDNDLPFKGEQGRLARVRAALDKHLIVLDFSGADPDRAGMGGGYVPELSAAIAAELQNREAGAGVRCVLLDYAGAMCERHLMATEKEDSALRHLLKRCILAIKNQIAVPYKSPVWVFHQLSGEANKKSSSAKYHHTDAAETKSFAENLDFNFIVGAQSSLGLCQLVASKHRRTGHMPARIVKVVGEFCRVDDMSAHYTVDPHTQAIVAKADANSATSDVAAHSGKAFVKQQQAKAQAQQEQYEEEEEDAEVTT